MHNFITIPSQGPLRCVVVKLKAHVVLSKRSQPQPLWLDGFMEQVEEDFWVINRDSPQRTQYQVWALEQFPSHWNIALWLLGNHKKMNGLSYTLSLSVSVAFSLLFSLHSALLFIISIFHPWFRSIYISILVPPYLFHSIPLSFSLALSFCLCSPVCLSLSSMQSAVSLKEGNALSLFFFKSASFSCRDSTLSPPSPFQSRTHSIAQSNTRFEIENKYEQHVIYVHV